MANFEMVFFINQKKMTISNNKFRLTVFSVMYLTILPIFCTEIKAEDNKKYLSFSTAVFDILKKDYASFEGRVEYLGPEFTWIVKPLTGFMANTDGALYFYGGAVFEIPLLSFLFLSPSFAPGIYYKSESKDLNFIFEFRTQIELALLLNNDIRVGININHISNASLGPPNPGVESIGISYYFPF